jgi:predicted DCC family thiol-disulfide oxidoreductase YuxK
MTTPVELDRTAAASAPAATSTSWDVELFNDGACPLCLREVRMLARRDRRRRISFIDIAAERFDPTTTGLSWETLMARIHGRLPDGTLIEGVEVFRRLYAALGLGRIVALSRLPGVAQLLDVCYRLFARHRLRLTGRCANRACTIHRPVSAPRPSQG